MFIININNIDKSVHFEINLNSRNQYEKKTHLFHKIISSELLSELRIHLLIDHILHLSALNLHLLNPGDILGHLQLSDQIRLLSLERFRSGQALHTNTPNGSRKRLRSDHLIGPAKPHTIQIPDTDRRQRLMPFFDLLRRRRRGRRRWKSGRPFAGTPLHRLRHHHVVIFNIRRLFRRSRRRATIPDAPQVLRRLYQPIRVSGLRETRRHERQHQLLVDQMRSAGPRSFCGRFCKTIVL